MLKKQNQPHRLPGQRLPTQLQLSSLLYTPRGTVPIPCFSRLTLSVKLEPRLSLSALRERLLACSLSQLNNKGNAGVGQENTYLTASHTSVCEPANSISGSSLGSGRRAAQAITNKRPSHTSRQIGFKRRYGKADAPRCFVSPGSTPSSVCSLLAGSSSDQMTTASLQAG